MYKFYSEIGLPSMRGQVSYILKVLTLVSKLIAGKLWPWIAVISQWGGGRGVKLFKPLR